MIYDVARGWLSMTTIRIRILKRIAKALCNSQTHKWVIEDSRSCPYSEIEHCKQTVYQCAICDHTDKGEVGGIGWKSCKGCDLRPPLPKEILH